MSGLQHSRWADAPVTAAAAGAGEDPNRGGRRDRDGKKPPTDRIADQRVPWVCKHGCGTHHPGKACPVVQLGQRMWAAVEQLRTTQSNLMADILSAPPSSSSAAVNPRGSSSPARRRNRRRGGGAITPTPGGSSIRPLPAAADGNNTSAGNRVEGELTNRQRRSRARAQAWRARREEQRQHNSAEDTQMDTETGTAAPTGESQPDSSASGAVPGTDALDGVEASVRSLRLDSGGLLKDLQNPAETGTCIVSIRPPATSSHLTVVLESSSLWRIAYGEAKTSSFLE
ncbi:hypothetical protein BDV37DRAFT_285333 [Aspergillus pseudonomiae]|uniref:Uncharacterized protein n=1 Tax=Aspergillus pseudonomiae TaxID=1506151 RepID=A0A5N7D5U6_9EURO|nr:uncharacterized protein BDV37DRAFT_285333 [Aspergillus pseudonomiae]KAE8401781.1 hypothetical protein BDV37DRAFT_285333 [Aspergillus pseudonomiae]